jgi:uncharacterized protein
MEPTALRGAGIGWRPPIAADLLRAPAAVDFVEVVAETGLASRQREREVTALADIWPVAVHGVKLSLGSTGGIDPDRARALGRISRAVRAPVISEHVAFVRAGGREIGHLTALPRTAAAVRTVARNVTAARRFLPDVPLLLENAACTVPWSDDEMTEGAFYAAIAAATGCDLLLDVANLYANAVNEGRDPRQALADFPLERAAMLHVAGGTFRDGFYVDTHAHPVPEPVLELVAMVAHRSGPILTLLERDDDFPPFAQLTDELRSLRQALAVPEGRAASVPPKASGFQAWAEAPADNGLGAAQARLATVLTADPLSDLDGFPEAAIQRTRAILARKRFKEGSP